MTGDRLCGLPRAARLGLLAQSLYYCHSEMYNLDVPHWEGLTAHQQHWWVRTAGDVMDSLKPMQEPSLFQRIADVARTEAAKVLSFRGQDTSDGRD